MSFDLHKQDQSSVMGLSVDENRRTILTMEVSQIPAFGHLTRLFQTITPIVLTEVQIKTDGHQLYPGFISAYLPRARHLTFKSERGCVAGQGELKKVHFDPLFIVNHTCALLRANINRLIRKTWCTTKDPKRLS